MKNKQFRLAARSLFWLKGLMHCIGLLPIIYLVLLVLNDKAGGDPVQYIIHYTGVGALNALIATLLISPIAKKFKQGMLLQTRRLVGLYVFAYASLHILAFFSLDLLFAWGLFFEEVLKRPYILVGAAAYLLLTALAFTSFKTVMRKMGRRWQKLHNAIYLIALLIPIHFYWSVKSEIIEPILYFIIMGLLLGIRLKKSRWWKQLSVKSKFKGRVINPES
jgi:sulfoxide reductase heme-binding subunit YedZ